MTSRRNLAAIAAVWASLVPGLVHAQSASVAAPTLTVGDEWVFDRTRETGPTHFARSRIDLRVNRIDDDAMLVGFKPDGSRVDYLDHRIALDWVQTRVIDGQETVTGRPFNFPMQPGKSWTMEFREAELHDGQSNTHWNVTYRVVGWTDVTTPAGTFHALEIKETGSTEAERIIPQVARTAAVATTIRTTTAGRTQRALRQVIHNTVYGEFYYVPSIKYYVKYFEEQYNADKVLTLRVEDMLASYKPGASAPPHSSDAPAE
ncbi:MAG TPA: hypothetical protein VGH03_04515 [Caulobacteraceae bacterium]|jgi:hypothetical protein